MYEHSQEEREEIARLWFGHPSSRPEILPNTRYYVLDTCVLLHHFVIIVNAIRSAFANRVAIQFILPAMVKLELERQACAGVSGNMVSTYAYWFQHDSYIIGCRELRHQTVIVLDQLNRLVMEGIPTFRHQHRDEVTAMKGLVNDDYILDCSVFFLRHVGEMVCLITNDGVLCKKADAFNCPRLHCDNYHGWMSLLSYCQIPRMLSLEDLPSPYPRRWYRGPYHFSRAELLKREMRHLTYLHFEDVIDVDKLQVIDLKSQHQVFNDFFSEEVDRRELLGKKRKRRPVKWVERPEVDSYLCYLPHVLSLVLDAENDTQ